MAPHGQGPAGDPAGSVPVSYELVARPLRKSRFSPRACVWTQLCAHRRPSHLCLHMRSAFAPCAKNKVVVIAAAAAVTTLRVRILLSSGYQPSPVRASSSAIAVFKISGRLEIRRRDRRGIVWGAKAKRKARRYRAPEPASDGFLSLLSFAYRVDGRLVHCLRALFF
jgi:hypothetical protein